MSENLDDLIVLLEAARKSYELRIKAALGSRERDHLAELPYLQAQLDKANDWIAIVTMKKIVGGSL